MPTLVCLICVEHSDSFEDVQESSIFYTNMSFKIPNIAVKCSKAPVTGFSRFG